MKEQILKLRSEGLTYKEICDILNCSKSTVSYYCNDVYRKNAIERIKMNKEKNPLIKKTESFKKEKRRLRVKCEHFQLRDNTYKGKRLPFDSEKLKFNWRDVMALLEENPRCYLTGDILDLENLNTISLDHKVPVSRGGDNTINNMGLCTKDANQSKAALTVDEYIELCKKVLTNFGYTIISPLPN
jgi:CRISPR/Cas system Type II protein with McrA/HNH and RuvC-like nuclease domain